MWQPAGANVLNGDHCRIKVELTGRMNKQVGIPANPLLKLQELALIQAEATHQGVNGDCGGSHNFR
jgi:hypothetical protein